MNYTKRKDVPDEIRKFASTLGKRGGAARVKLTTLEQRKEWSSRGGRARKGWRKVKI